MRLATLLAFGLCAAIGSAAAAQTPPPAPQQPGGHGAAHKACAIDLARFCPGVEPGGGRIRQCFRGHFAELTEPCRTALLNARAARAAGAMPH